MRYACDVRAQALEALKLDPKHPGALHVMVMWNYTVMSLSGKLDVGIVSCPELLPDLWDLADDFSDALDELLDATR